MFEDALVCASRNEDEILFCQTERWSQWFLPCSSSHSSYTVISASSVVKIPHSRTRFMNGAHGRRLTESLLRLGEPRSAFQRKSGLRAEACCCFISGIRNVHRLV